MNLFNGIFQCLGRLVISAVLVALPLTSAAQSIDNKSRFPETGIAILNCKPSKPAPEESCTLRVPVGQLRGGLSHVDVGNQKAEFEFVKPGFRLFPSDLILSATILLIDLTPGPNGGRNQTFAFERTLIESFANKLPEDELIAIYGFNESLERIVDFTDNREQVINAIKGLRLRGANTRIATHTKTAIEILDKKHGVLFKNIIVISDGEEEGIGQPDLISKQAIDAEVSISAMGMFWRTIGSAKTGEGMDYLDSLTKGGLGFAASVQLRNRQISTQKIDKLADALELSWGKSGLIIPLNTPQPADVTVSMEVPVAGQAGNFREKDVSARFVPLSNPSETSDESPAETTDGMLFGYPELWVYIAAGTLLLFLLLLILLISRNRSGNEEDAQLDDLEDLDDLGEDDAKTAIAGGDAIKKVKVAPAAHAFLVLSDSKKRLPLSGQRISIGRSSSNRIPLQDDSISRVHAELHRNRNGGYSITDMNSLNGTFVNDVRITGTLDIRAGDMLKFGELETKLVLA